MNKSKRVRGRDIADYQPRLVMDSTEADSFLNYPHDHTAIVDHQRTMGPNRLGEYFVPVEATYDTDRDSTRVGFVTLRLEYGDAR